MAATQVRGLSSETLQKFDTIASLNGVNREAYLRDLMLAAVEGRLLIAEQPLQLPTDPPMPIDPSVLPSVEEVKQRLAMRQTDLAMAIRDVVDLRSLLRIVQAKAEIVSASAALARWKI